MRDKGLGCVVSLSDTHKIEAILYADGKQVASDEYVKLLVELANKKLLLSRERMEVLRKAIESSTAL